MGVFVSDTKEVAATGGALLAKYVLVEAFASFNDMISGAAMGPRSFDLRKKTRSSNWHLQQIRGRVCVIDPCGRWTHGLISMKQIY